MRHQRDCGFETFRVPTYESEGEWGGFEPTYPVVCNLAHLKSTYFAEDGCWERLSHASSEDEGWQQFLNEQKISAEMRFDPRIKRSGGWRFKSSLMMMGLLCLQVFSQ